MDRYLGSIDNKEVYSYALENEFIKIEVSNFGATIMSFIDKSNNVDIICGFHSLNDMLKQNGSYSGMTVGRCANRIAKGKFKLDNHSYQLPINNGPNSLHGGLKGLSFRVYDTKRENNKIIFNYLSKDMEEGYPGNLDFNVTYELIGNKLKYEVSGLSDKDTIFNITNHAYFNLDATDSICEHQLLINTNKVAMVDEDGLTKDEVIDSKGTAFDFMEFRFIGDNLGKSHPNIEIACGYDHNYIFENNNYLKACLKGRNSILEIYSDLENMHLYSANYLDEKLEDGTVYKKRQAICFECQYFPNAINYEDFEKPILKKDEKQTHYIEYVLKKGDRK